MKRFFSLECRLSRQFGLRFVKVLARTKQTARIRGRGPDLVQKVFEKRKELLGEEAMTEEANPDCTEPPK